MNFRLILSAFIILTFYTSCKKKETVTTAPTGSQNPMPLASTQQHQQTGTAQMQTSSYPYTDTYIGRYNENNPDVYPQNYSGTSTVYVTHVSADTIVIFAQSIGIPHGTTNYPGNVNAIMGVNPTNTYKLSSQWFEDRTDGYTCVIANDTLHCDIVQSSACAGNMGEFDGFYTGYKKK